MFEGLQKSYPRVRRWQKAVFESLEIIFSENQKKKKKKTLYVLHVRVLQMPTGLSIYQCFLLISISQVVANMV